jgi:hypothetical protein
MEVRNNNEDRNDRDGALSINQFCQRYSVGRTFAYEQIGAGKLPTKKAGARRLIPVEAAREWFASLPGGDTMAAA